MGKDSFSDMMKRNMELNMAVQASKGADGKPDPYKASAIAASMGHRSMQDTAMLGAMLGSQGAFDESSDRSSHVADSYSRSMTYQSRSYGDFGSNGNRDLSQNGIKRDDSYASHYDKPPRNHNKDSRNRKIMWFVLIVIVLCLIAYGVSASVPKCAYEDCDEAPMDGSEYCERHDSIMKNKEQDEQYMNDLISGKVTTSATTQTEATTESSSVYTTTETSTRSYYKRKNSSSTEKKRSLDGYDNPDDFAGDTYDEFDGEDEDDQYESAYEYWEEEAEEVEDEE